MVVSAVHVYQRVSSAFQRGGSFKVAVPNAIPNVWCGILWNNQTAFLMFLCRLQVSARILVLELKCNRQCKQLKPYIRCMRCSLCNLCLHGSTRRTAFGILVKSKDKQFSNDVHQGSPSIVEVYRNLGAKVLLLLLQPLPSIPQPDCAGEPHGHCALAESNALA